MKAYLIDPYAMTVTEVEHNGHFKQINELIDAHFFDVARINEHGDGVYVDDEGLFTNTGFFSVPGYPNPLAGKGLILGCDEMGDSKEPHVTFEQIIQSVRFFTNIGGSLFEVAA